MRAMSSLLLALRARALLGEQLDDHLLLHRDLDVLPDGQSAHGAFLLVDVHLEPGGNLSPARAKVVGHALLHLGGGTDLHDLPHPHDVGGDGDLAAVDLDVPMPDHLTRLSARGGHAQAEHHIVQPALEQLEQVLPRTPALALGDGEVAAELALQHTVDALGLLLLAELDAVVRELRPGQSVLARRIVPPLDGALVAEAPRALEEQLDAFTPALPAGCRTISRQRSLLPYTRRRLGGRHPLCGIGVTSRMAEISRPTAWSDRMAASRPAPGPRTNTSTCFRPKSMALRAAFSAAVWAAKGVLLRALEPHAARAHPRDHVAHLVREGDDGVVEGRLHVGNAHADFLPLALAPALAGGGRRLGFFLLCRFVSHARRSLLLGGRGGSGRGRRSHRLLLDHDALALALAGAGVRVRALPAHGQALAMANAAV